MRTLEIRDADELMWVGMGTADLLERFEKGWTEKVMDPQSRRLLAAGKRVMARLRRVKRELDRDRRAEVRRLGKKVA